MTDARIKKARDIVEWLENEIKPQRLPGRVRIQLEENIVEALPEMPTWEEVINEFRRVENAPTGIAGSRTPYEYFASGVYWIEKILGLEDDE